jgi:ribonuclease-3
MSLPDALERLAAALGHRFADPRWLELAVTHRSYANERAAAASASDAAALDGRDNERLEFLGDAVIGLAAAALLTERFPAADEGELTRRRADLVSGPALARIARSLDLGPALRLGVGEERTGGRDKPRLLASALEACVGALHRDAGPLVALAAARRLLEDRDPKSRLQERLQDEGRATPRYELAAEHGPEDPWRYEVVVRSGDETLGAGRGRSKVEAERDAARAALRALGLEPTPPASSAGDGPLEEGPSERARASGEERAS